MSKKVLNRRVLLQLVATAPVIGLTATAAQAKIAPNVVGYQTTPKGEAKCSGCALFIAPNACKTVDGEISPEGWCKVYSKKPA